MEKTKKMIIIPEEHEQQISDQHGGADEPSFSKNRFSFTHKIINIIKIIYKLANIKAFDNEGRIRGENGYIPKTD
jgi:hypothetical protein